MTRKTKVGIAIGLGVLGAVGFYVYKQVQYAKMLCFSLGKFKLKGASLSQVNLGMSFEVKNLDKLNVTIASLSMDVYSKGKFITHVEQNSPVEINPNSETEMPFDVTVFPKEFLANISSLVSGGGYMDIPLEFKGKARVKKLGITFGIPFSETYTIKELSVGEADSPC